MSSSYCKTQEANKIMEYGDPEPVHLPTLNSLRVMKYKGCKKNLLHKDLTIALSLLKGTVPYNKIIQDIGLDRFFLHY